MDYQPNCSWQSARLGHVLGSLVVVLPPPLRQSGSPLRSFRQFEPSALGCRSEKSASMGKTSIAFTRATSFLCDAEWTECSSNCLRGGPKLSPSICTLENIAVVDRDADSGVESLRSSQNLTVARCQSTPF